MLFATWASLEPPRNAPTVHATYFQGNYLAPPARRILKEPVCMFFSLHPADDAPRSVSMGHGEGHPFGAIFRYLVVVVLINLDQVSSRP